MPWWGWLLLGVGGIVPLFFAWAAIHELSHYFVAQSVANVRDARFMIYPHVDPAAGFRFAAVTWSYNGPQPEGKEKGLIFFAPRIPNMLGALLFPVAAAFGEPWGYIWAYWWLGALIDGAYGSIGYTYFSDLQRVERAWSVSPWLLRIGGWGVAVVSATIGVVLLILLVAIPHA